MKYLKVNIRCLQMSVLFYYKSVYIHHICTSVSWFDDQIHFVLVIIEGIETIQMSLAVIVVRLLIIISYAPSHIRNAIDAVSTYSK